MVFRLFLVTGFLVLCSLFALGATGAQVRFRAGNQVTTQRFPMEEVYFFKAGGLMATAATDPDLVGVGSQVLIPEPPRQSVAGSREESTYRNGTVTIKPATVRKARPSPLLGYVTVGR